MQRELILLCHGKADTSLGLGDYHLPLKDRGKRDAQLIGSWLQQQELIPDHILTSPAKPAFDTAEHVCNVMGLGARAIKTEERIYKADKKVLLNLLADCPDNTKRVLLVGHNPALEKLLRLLSDEKIKMPKDGKLFPAASLAVLYTAKDWSKLKPGKVTLRALTRPGNLPRKFPFLNQDNILEWRDRPAYYYSQSAVIPYRIHKGRTEILVITSSSNKRWIIPKGIVEIGMSPQDSAGKEAFEEAGVLGRVGEVLLGTYRHTKWGADCKVKVYPMEVHQVISEEERLEPQRQRRWIPAEEAPRYLKQQALLPLVLKLAEQLMLSGNP